MNKFKLKHKSKKKKLIFTFSILIVLAIMLCCYLVFVVNPIIVQANEATIKNLTSMAVNDALTKTISNKNYEDFIDIEKNENGEITLISANSSTINSLANSLVQEIITNLNDLGSKGIDIPLGTFSGISLLNGVGPNINIKLIPLGNVEAKFNSQFIQAGINQTNHKLKIHIETQVELILPLKHSRIDFSAELLLAESIIVGKVPEVYLNSGVLNNLLNLVP